MILAHLSDIHLGFRLFPREERGLNLRERDVARAFRAAIREVVRIGPGLVVISGDVFDRPHPPASALATFGRGLQALRSGLSDVPVLLVAGARDTPLRLADPGVLAAFDGVGGVEAASGSPRSVYLDDLDAHVLLLPHRALSRSPFPEVRPDPDRRWNVLIARGDPSPSAGPVVDPSGWDYIGAGCGHRRRQLGPRAFQAGSLERVGGEPWSEADEEKGFVVFDLAAGRCRFRSVPGRPAVELAFDVAEDDAENGGFAGKLVHLRVPAATDGGHGLAPFLLARLRGEAAHLRVVVDEPEGKPPLAGGSSGEPKGPHGFRVRAIGRVGGGGANLSGRIVGSGLVALVVRDAPVRRDLLASLRSALAGTGTESEDPGSLFHVELSGGGGAGGGGAVEARVLAHLRWAARAPDLDEMLHASGRILASVLSGAGAGVEPGGAEPGEEAAAPLERALRHALEEAAVLEGDLEASTVEWLRERQDAETRLLAYRDRARELRSRIRRLEASGKELPCPTCGAVLGGRYEEVLAALRDEWESLVQDGTWWKRRSDQLEPKPQRVREMERASIRLQARLRELSESVEKARSLREKGPEEAEVSALRAALLARASRLLNLVTGGEVEGLPVVAGRTGLEVEGAESAVALALRLAALELAAERGVVPACVVFPGLLDELGADAELHALELLRRRFAGITQRLVVTTGSLPERFPDLFDSVLEVLPDPGPGRPPLRVLSSGNGRIVFTGD